MKLFNVAAIVAVAALSAAACAQRPQGGPGGPGGPGRPGGPGGFGGFGRRSPQEMADRQTQMMTQFLALTPAQQAKVKALILKNETQIRKIRDGQMAQIKKLLTPDQAKKISSMPRPGMGGPGGPGGFGGGRGPGGPGMRRGA